MSDSPAVEAARQALKRDQYLHIAFGVALGMGAAFYLDNTFTFVQMSLWHIATAAIFTAIDVGIYLRGRP